MWLVLFYALEGGETMSEVQEVWCGKELERLAMQPDTVVNIAIGGDEDGEESVSAETGVRPAESGEAATVGNTGQDATGCCETCPRIDCGLRPGGSLHHCPSE